ncbi:YadA-like family protein [Actinobacillus porcinus]|uniref:YadA-like family protein n=1 Tax=Actinobacillus porcinus TaxID=51048 RepID=UPI002A91D205|nr:YadA-like family protein [Actinobacillus porcinus]MDY5421300.1 YadA-like family protein [Actinobacillus porcinus]
MNKIFKVIFNKTTGKLVVVSELAKAEGKAKSQTDERSSLSSASSLLNLGLAGAIVLSASFVPNNAFGWVNSADMKANGSIDNGTSVIIGAGASEAGKAKVGADGSVAIGANASANNSSSVVIGKNATSNGQYSVALGSQANVTVEGGTSVGDNTTSQKNAVAMGRNAAANSREAVVIGFNAAVNTNLTGSQSVAIGSGTVVNASQAIGIGNQVSVEGYGAIALGGDDIGVLDDIPDSIQGITGIKQQYTGNWGTNEANRPYGRNAGESKLYTKTAATGRGSVALGAQAQGIANWTTAIGTRALANKEAATAVGMLSKATGNASFAGGLNATASNNYTTATGANATSSGESASAYGYNTTATGKNSVAVGKDAAATSSNTTSIGMNATASSESGSAYGYNATSSGGNSVAVGKDAAATGPNTTAIGMNSTASNESASAYGYNATSSGTNSVAVGKDAQATRANATAIGMNAQALNENTIAIGRDAVARTQDVGGLAIGKNANATGKGNFALGTSAFANYTTGSTETQYAMAIGDTSRANATRSLALGVEAKVHENANGAVAIGNGTNVLNNSTSAIAIGNISKVGTDSDQAIAIGYNANLTNNTAGSVAIGGTTKVESKHAVALGYNTSIAAGKEGAVVLGANSNSTGSHAITDVNSATINGITYSGFKGDINATTGGSFVSVGSNGTNAQRKIINVAAGVIDATSTEAINGSQLYAVATQVGTNAQNIATNTQNIANNAQNIANNTQNITTLQNARTKYFSVNSTVTENADNAGATATNAIAVGPNASSAGQNSIAIGWGSTVPTSIANAIAIGTNATSTGNSGTAVGNSARSAKDAAAFGVLANATQERATAIGPVANALGNGATAVGNNTNASGISATAIGNSAKALGNQTTAIGVNANASSDNSIAIGNGTTANGNYATAIGNYARALNSTNATVIGRNTYVDGNSADAVVLGSNSSVGVFSNRQNVGANQSIVVGSNSYARSNNVTVLGSGVTVNQSYDNAVVLGANSNVNGSHTIANETSATVNNITYSGFAGTVNSTGNFVSVGSNATDAQRKIINVAAGNVSSTSTEAINGSQLYAVASQIGQNKAVVKAGANTTVSTKVNTTTGGTDYTVDISDATKNDITNIKNNITTLNNSKTKYFSVKSTVTENANNACATGTNALAIGPNASSVVENGIAIGTNVTSGAGTQKNTIAIGYNSSATLESAVAYGANTRSSGVGSVAIGRTANASTKGAIAIGVSSHVISGDHAMAIGDTAKANGTRSLALGVEAKTNADYATALGNKATANGTNSVALGNSSTALSNNVTVLGSGVTVNQGFDNAVVLGANSNVNGSHTIANVTEATVNGITYSGFAGTVNSTGNFVSVGGSEAGQQRKIINVAAGAIDQNSTEAINGSQLYAVAKSFEDSLKNLPTTLPKNLAEKLGLPTDSTGNVTDLGIPAVAGSNNANTAPTTLTQAVKDVAVAVNKGISIRGNDAQGINKTLGETFDIVGSHTGNEVSSTNIKTRKTDDGKLEIVMAEKPEFKGATIGENGKPKTVIGENGVEVKKVDGTKGTVLGPNGLDNGGNKITNVMAGSTDNDAVNYSQLKSLENTLNQIIGTPAAEEARAVYDEMGRKLTSGDVQGQLSKTTEAVNKGIKYGGEMPDDYKALTSGSQEQRQQLGSKLSVVATSSPLVPSTGPKANKNFVGDNLVTKYTRNEDGSGTIAIGLSDKPEFKEVTVKDPDNPTKSTTLKPTGTVVTDGPKEATYGVDGIGLKGDDGKTTKLGRDENGNLTIQKEGEAPVTLATQGISGSGKDGKDGKDATDPTAAASKGATAQDGLNGKDLTTKVNALRNGEAGPVVYTNAAGERLVKANNGQYYPADQVEANGEPKTGATPEANPIASVVNPDGTTTKPTTMGNVKSTIGLNGKDATGADSAPITADAAKNAVAGADGQSGLLAKKGAELNNVATVGDLQAIAQAGLDFTGNNSDTTVHRPLGTKLTVVGERDDSKTAYTADESAKNNLIVEADSTNNKLTVKMANELKNLKSIEASDSIKVGTGDETTTIAKDGTSIKGADGKSAEYKLDGSKVDDGQGNTTEVKAAGLTAKDADSTTAVTADGMTVGPKDATATDKSSATYGKDGLTVKGNDGKDAIALESKTGTDGATTNTLTLEGKDGKDAVSISSGENGKDPSITFAKNTDGTGSGVISGLATPEKNADGTLKDKTQAASAGYVEDRLAEMNDGKPFEYFEKDPATGELKKDADGNPIPLVRGKDGKFYPASELKGKIYDPVNNVYKDANGVIVPADKAVDANNVIVQAMPSPTGKLLEMGNIGSGLGLDDTEEGNKKPLTADQAKKAMNGTPAKDGQPAKPGLLEQTGASLNNAATVKDLQALAQAGLDFTGNNSDITVHRPLGTKLTVVGERDDNKTSYTADESAKNNLIVEANATTNTLTVKMAKDLKNLKSIEASDSIKVGTGNETTTIAKDGTSIKGADGKSAEYKLDGSKVAVKDPTTGETKETTMEADGTHATVKDKDGNPTKSADYTAEGTTVKAKDKDGNDLTTTVKADGVTATDKDSKNTVNADGMTVGPKDDTQADKSTATYGRDGMTVKGNDGKDAIALTSTTGTDGKTTNALTLEGKDGKDAVSITSGKDGETPEISFAKDGNNGTGSITGLKDVERNSDGTAKDRTAAANAGYVDDRLKEMNEGKPFEYFEKDPTTGEVKKDADGKPVQLVRGKDGNFYKPSELEGATYNPASGKYEKGGNAITATVDANNVTVQAMPSPTGSPIEMSHIGSGLGLDDSETGNNTALTADDAQKAIAGDAKDGNGGLLTKTGPTLNNAATVKDLQALAQAGLDFTGDNNTTVHRPLGTKLTVEGEGTWNGTSSATDNLYVEANATNNTLTVKMNSNLTGLNTVGLKGADGNVTTIGRDADGNLTVTNGKDGANAQPQKLVTEGNIANMKGTDGKDGKDGAVDADGNPISAGATGLTGKDGLNGASLNDKINALRNGEAGPVVYTDADGKRLEKANDGKYYLANQVNADGTTVTGATAVASPIASVVNPDGSTAAPVKLGNIANAATTYGDNGDLVKVGDVYYNKADLIDGQPKADAVVVPAAKAGIANLDAAASNTALTVADAKNLGWVLTTPNNNYNEAVNNADQVNFVGTGGVNVSGKTNATTGAYVVEVALSEAGKLKLAEMKAAAGDATLATNAGKVAVEANDAGFVGAKNIADMINGAGWKTNSTTATGGAKDTLISAGDVVNFEAGKNIQVTQTVNATTGAVSYTYATADKVSFDEITLGDTANGKTTITNAGTVVTDKDGNIATYDANGLTVKDANGNNAITLVSNAAGPSLSFAKNADGTGTGKITGVAAGDITPDSTDVVTGAQIYAFTGGLAPTANHTITNQDGSTTNVSNVVVAPVEHNVVNADGTPKLDAQGNPITETVKEVLMKTYNVYGNTEYVSNSAATAIYNMNEQGIKFFHTNDGTARPEKEKDNEVDSSASGVYATAVGVQAQATGTNAIAMGKGATAKGENSIAIGTGNQVEASKSGAFGDPNIIMGTTSENDAVSGSYAIGNDNVINSSNTFVLGNDVNNRGNENGKPVAMGDTVENSVYLGNKTTATAGDGSKTGTLKNRKQDGTEGTTTTAGSTGTVSSAKVGNMTYGGFAGAKAHGVVSVGAAGKERRIQNVAAGEISATSTDAINGSQLYSVASNLNNKINRSNKEHRAGIAGANAAAGLPQVYTPGKSMVAASAGTYKGQSALAVGYSRSSDNGKVILKLQGNTNTSGDFGGSVGVGYQW